MYTQCPYCQTLFQISREQLLTANGKAHCCRCDRIFNARENLRESASAGATSATSPSDANTWTAAAPMIEQRPDTLIEDEASRETGDKHSRQDLPDQDITGRAEEQISISHPFDHLPYDDRTGGLPKTEASDSDKDEQAPLELIPDLEIESSLFETDREQFSAYYEEEITGSIPGFDDIKQDGRDNAIPTFILDPVTPKEADQEAWQTEPETSLEPEFGTEFILGQLEQADTTPSGPIEPIPGRQDFTDSYLIPETPPEVGSLLQEREPGETGSESTHSEHTLRQEEPEPLFPDPEDPPEIEPTEGESLLPEEILTTPARNKRHGFAWSIAALLLLLLAVGQLSWLGRDQLMNYPTARKLFDSFCQLTGCQLPEQRAPDQLEILNRSVASHPHTPNALQILLTLSNQAGFAQPYPQIQLSLFNTKDELLARRRFRPDEYLNQTAGGYPLLQPKQPVQLEIVLRDPGEEATGFKFDFF